MAEELTPRGQVVHKRNGKGLLILAALILPIVFGLGGGALMYFYLTSTMEIGGMPDGFGPVALEEELYQSGEVISALETRIAELEEELGTEGEVPDPMAGEHDYFYEDRENLGKDLPAISWDRADLLTQADRNDLQTKLIDPYFEYHNEEGFRYIAMVITVPEEEGDPYEVRTVHRNGGGEGFYFGNRGQDSDWWYPECLGDCYFSSQFRAKYPEIIASRE